MERPFKFIPVISLGALSACNPLPFLENGGAVGILVTVIGTTTYFMYRSHEKYLINLSKKDSSIKPKPDKFTLRGWK